MLLASAMARFVAGDSRADSGLQDVRQFGLTRSKVSLNPQPSIAMGHHRSDLWLVQRSGPLHSCMLPGLPKANPFGLLRNQLQDIEWIKLPTLSLGRIALEASIE